MNEEQHMSHIFYKALFAMIWLLPTSGIATAQEACTLNDLLNTGSEETVVVNVWAPASTDRTASIHDEAQLSQGFTVTGLKATSALLEWQRHLAYALQNGYPLAEFWIRMDRDRAADAVRLATVIATTQGDKRALEQLLSQFQNLRQWSD